MKKDGYKHDGGSANKVDNGGGFQALKFHCVIHKECPSFRRAVYATHDSRQKNQGTETIYNIQQTTHQHSLIDAPTSQFNPNDPHSIFDQMPVDLQHTIDENLGKLGTLPSRLHNYLLHHRLGWEGHYPLKTSEGMDAKDLSLQFLNARKTTLHKRTIQEAGASHVDTVIGLRQYCEVSTVLI